MAAQKTSLQKLAEILTLIMLGIILNVFDWILALLPNIELVTPLLIVYTYKFRSRALISAYVYTFLEIITHGINIWNIMYLYVWALLVLLMLPLTKIGNKKKAVAVLSIAAGLYGLGFGTLCSIPHWFAEGPTFAVSWIVSGFSFDLIHAVSNFVTTLLLYIPLTKVLDKVKI